MVNQIKALNIQHFWRFLLARRQSKQAFKGKEHHPTYNKPISIHTLWLVGAISRVQVIYDQKSLSPSSLRLKPRRRRLNYKRERL